MDRILWAVKIGDEDWQEQIISTDATKFPAARAWAIANGFDRLRESVMDDGPPRFDLCLNRTPKRKR